MVWKWNFGNVTVCPLLIDCNMYEAILYLLTGLDLVGGRLGSNQTLLVGSGGSRIFQRGGGQVQNVRGSRYRSCRRRGSGVWGGVSPFHQGGTWGGGCAPFPDNFLKNLMP